MNTEKLKEQLIEHESLRLKPYRCSAGKLTIGVGRNLDDNGISKSEAMFMLDNDIDVSINDLHKIFPDFNNLNETLQMVLIDMMFNLGLTRFRKFKKMIAAVKTEDWKEMVVQMKDSAWYRQVGIRAKNLIKMIESM